MAYKRFDDPNKAVDDSAQGVHDAFWLAAQRRALQSISNRILRGNFGTAGTTAAAAASAMLSGCQTGGTGGIGVANPLAIVINGKAGTTASAGSFWLPAGTQGASTYTKYGIFIGFGTSGTVLAGNEGTSSTTAMLPDPPDGLVCVGYMEYAAGTSPWNRGANVVTGQTGSAGTATFTDLIHYPYDIPG